MGQAGTGIDCKSVRVMKTETWAEKGCTTWRNLILPAPESAEWARQAGTVAPAKPILGKCPVLSRVTGVPAGLRAVPWPAPSLAARPATWLRPPVRLY